MFRLLKNGDVYAPEHIGKADILICNDKIWFHNKRTGNPNPLTLTTRKVCRLTI